MTSNTRLARAYRVLARYAREIGDPNAETATLVSDILADLMHLCEHDGLSFDNRLKLARLHWEAER